VNWIAPSSDGGSPILLYTVTASPGATVVTVGPNDRFATFTGLIVGTAYTFTVTATNAVGESLSSPSSNPITPYTVPDPPIGVAATAGDASATVSWSPPAFDGGSDIFQYAVISSPDGMVTYTDGSITSTRVTGLMNGRPYTFSVRATNVGGDSNSSNPSNSVTPQGTVAADSIPPTTSAASSPPPNPAGWHRTAAAITLTAADNSEGSGVREIHYSLSGAENGTGSVLGAEALVNVSAEGTTTLTYFATDMIGNQERPQVMTVRIDRTPPLVDGLPAQGCVLWPPDHRLVQVASVAASDSLSGLASGSTVITGVSNEPENGPGDGDVSPDVVVSHGVVQLRAERSGTGASRVYTLAVTATDAAGNTTSGTAACTVPHDR
jgi:hypothetical protein